MNELLTDFNYRATRARPFDQRICALNPLIRVRLFGEWGSCDEVCEIRKGEPLYVANTKIPKNVVNRRDRFLTNDAPKGIP